MYDPHPSTSLNRGFAARPFQGAEPEKATFLFVGLDANYSPVIEQNAVFACVLEYLADGAAFWRRYGVHHPFLLPEYRGDGQYYHRTFASIGFRPEHAEQVSFIELLHVPTVGRSRLEPADLNVDHLRRINAAIERDGARYVFIPPDVGRLMRASTVFPWMPKVPGEDGGALKVWRRTATTTVYWHYHFSYWGKPEKAAQLKAIGQLAGASA